MKKNTVFKTAGIAAASLSAALLFAPAAVAQPHDWSGVANCESGGVVNINTGNGYYGMLQFSQSSWQAAGGLQYASRADLATKEQQEEVAYNLLQMQGIGAWPTCGKYIKYNANPTAPQPAPEPEPVVVEAPKREIVVPELTFTVIPAQTFELPPLPEGEIPENPWGINRQAVEQEYDNFIKHVNIVIGGASAQLQGLQK